MAKLTDEERESRRFNRAMETARAKRLSTLKNLAASALQEAIRAEYGANTKPVKFWDHEGCKIHFMATPPGFCVCVTCGLCLPWKGKGSVWGTMHAGHFLPTRRLSILFDERNVHPQCSGCNKASGNPAAYFQFMLAEYGQDVIDDLHRLKHSWSVKFEREDYVRMRLSYVDRTKIAVKKMAGQ